MACIISLFGAHVACADATANLVGWWALDDGSGTTALDSSVNGYNGALQGSSLPIWTANGHLGSALVFDGSSGQEVSVSSTTAPNLNNIALTNGQSLSVSVWIYPTMSDNNQYVILDKGVWNLSVTNKTALNFFYRTGGNWAYFSTSSALTLNSWNHIVVNGFGIGNTKITFYINDASTTVSASPTPSDNFWNTDAPYNLLIGGTYGINGAVGASPFKGNIDDVRVYNAKLSETDIANLYNESGSEQTPTVSAGSNQNITFPATASLSGSVTEAGLPAGYTLVGTWSQISGPGTVSFANANAISTTAAFSMPGTYVLQLYGSNGVQFATSSLLVTVNPVAYSSVTDPRGLSPSGWTISDLNSGQSMSAVIDNNLATSITSAPNGSSPAGTLIDMGSTNTIDRVYFTGPNPTLQIAQYGITPTQPPALVVVYVGNTTSTSTMTRAGEFMVPWWNTSSPIAIEGDIRFSPVQGRYIRMEMQTAVNWSTYGNGWTNAPASTTIGWQLSELEVYGFTGTYSNQDAVVIPTAQSTNSPFTVAAGDLSYYLGQLEGRPVSIVVSNSTSTVMSSYPGVVYDLMDLASLAPNYAAMVANEASGTLPLGVNVVKNGSHEVDIKAWPYRNVLESAWAFLRKEGVRWVYPDPHGDYVPNTGGTVDLSFLPLTSTSTPPMPVYANYSANSFEPWGEGTNQTIRQDYLYFWRNGYTGSWNIPHVFGGSEVPSIPYGPPIPSQFSGFRSDQNSIVGDFSAVISDAVVAAHQADGWCSDTTGTGNIVCPTGGSPTFNMSNSGLIGWVATEIAAMQNYYSRDPNNYSYYNRAWQLTPQDATHFDQGATTTALNSPAQYNTVAWGHLYNTSQSGSYFNFINQVAIQAATTTTDLTVGALAYADVFMPPHNIPRFSPNVHIEITQNGAPNLPMSSPINAQFKAAEDLWAQKTSSLTNYDWALLTIDYFQQNPEFPAPLIAGIVDHAQYLNSIGALGGGTQAGNGSNGGGGLNDSIKYNPWDYYGYTRIRQDITQTAGSIETEFFDDYYQESATPMLAFYQALENWQVNNNVNLHYIGFDYGPNPGFVSLATLAVMQADLQTAEADAQYWVTTARVAAARADFNTMLSMLGLQGVNLSDTSPYQSVGQDGSTVNLDLWQNAVMPSITPVIYHNGLIMGSPGNYYWRLYAGTDIYVPVNFTQSGGYDIALTVTGNTGTYGFPRLYVGPQSLGSLQFNSPSTPVTLNLPITIPSGYGVQNIRIMQGNTDGGTIRISNIAVTRRTVTPTVHVLTASSVAQASATLSGSIDGTGGADATQHGFVYGTAQDMSNVIATTTLGSQTGTGTFSQSISGLACNTIYYYTAYATNSAGMSTSFINEVDSQDSGILSFTTAPCQVTIPTLTVQLASSITATGATLTGTMTADGNASSTIEGFNWGTDTSYGHVASSTGTYGIGPFSQPISGLTCNTTYHYQSFATNPVGTASSTDQSFTTSACPSTGGNTSSGGGGGGGGGSSPYYTLTVTKQGTGLGTATSSPVGITCGSTCSYYFYAGSTVILNALPQTGSHLTSWTGCTSIATSSCTVALTGNETVTVSFSLGSATTTITNTTPVSLSNCPANLICTPISPGGLSTTTTLITKLLSIGSIDPEVIILQELLNGNGYQVTASGAGSIGHEIATFGPATLKTLQKFQCTKLYICSGSPTTTDYGSTDLQTRNALNALPNQPVGTTTTPQPSTIPSTGSTSSLKSSSGPSAFTRSLTLGSTGSDVKALQVFLNTNGYTVASTGNGSPGNETTYFGQATKSALERYQCAKGIACSGDPGYGMMGPRTTASIEGKTIPVTTMTPATTIIPTKTTTITTPTPIKASTPTPVKISVPTPIKVSTPTPATSATQSSASSPTTPPVSNFSIPSSTNVSSVSGLPLFTIPLTTGSTGKEIKNLQIFLNDLGFTVAVSGNDSPGNETQTYDTATAAAVKRFQKAYSSQITSYGGGAPSGVFDDPTMEAANSIISP